MKEALLPSIALAVFWSTAAVPPIVGPDDQPVVVTERPEARRVDVSIDGRPFTSYIYPTSLEKPVLYPIQSARGTLVTRGFPLEPRPGERTDHPHHVGHWFNYGDVNGYDFWGHSSATPAENLPKMGTILHKEVTRAAGGPEQGELAVRADWVVPVVSRRGMVSVWPRASTKVDGSVVG